MRDYGSVCDSIRGKPRVWLITGVAGFIGSNILEALLQLNQKVVGLDNFSTGHRRNLEEVSQNIDSRSWSNFRFIEGDIRDASIVNAALSGVDYVLHQAALGSVPRSIDDPLTSNAVNIDGFLNVLNGSRTAGVQRVVYAASSSTYGDHPGLPKVEEIIGRPLSPYAVTKLVNELYAEVFARCYGFTSIGLRYFNVFGKRQDPDGAYAAVIPKWIAAMIRGQGVTINGDGQTSRDFCFVENAVQANILAATASDDASNQVYNVAYGERTTLGQLFEILQTALSEQGISYNAMPNHGDFRPGDVKHSLADIKKAASKLGYCPRYSLAEGVRLAMPWYVKHLGCAR